MSTQSVSSARSGIARSTILLVFMAETAFFGTLLMAYLYMRTSPMNAMFRPVAPVDRLLAGLNTAVLLISMATAHRAEAAIRSDRPGGLKTNLLYSLALGVLFIIGQVFEFSHSGMAVSDAFFGGVFFTLITFHALHVLAGMTLLAINERRALRGDFTAQRYTAVQLGAWFWYYVAAVWCVLFAALYLV